MNNRELRQKFRTHIAVGLEEFEKGRALSREGSDTLARAHIDAARQQFQLSTDEHKAKWYELACKWLNWIDCGRKGPEPKDNPHSNWMRGIWSLNSAATSGRIGDPVERQIELFEKARGFFEKSKHPDASAKAELCKRELARLTRPHPSSNP